ncbi:MAG TPA: protein kinase [Polyangiaceae bacterium]|nr:protein kinase [Polyangiaceae bacterium]
MADESVPVPKRLAEFEVIRRLGVGGMAEVFLAKKRGAEGTYKLLVVKRILPQYGESARFRTMFAEEAMLATRLNHPNIVQVYEFQDYAEDGQLLSMEYVEGPDLRKVMRAARAKRTRLPPYVSAYIVGEVAKGLHYAHDRKDERGNPMEIVHRDVSPQNILLSFEGSVKIADFGIASANLFREEPGILKGKTGYMSPEQARGEKVDRRTDIYSLGVVFHELLTGRALHGAAEGNELLDAVRAGQVEPPSTFVRDVPRDLELLVMKALSRDVEERFSTARDFAAAITRALFQSQQPIDAHTLESVLEQIVSREHTSPGFAAPLDALQVPGDASRSVGLQTGDSVGEGLRDEVPDEAIPAQVPLQRSRRTRQGQEVRHVAIVALQLHGTEQFVEAAGAHDAARFIEKLQQTLGEIAFKRGARLTWHHDRAVIGDHLLPSGGAMAIVGLMANPARAAADAAWLAIDIHEATQGACDDAPVELQASIGIVRGIATGKRDRAGHLVNHMVEEPAPELARMLGRQAPAGGTWVAGGLYRLVRRDFVWSDAPTIAIESSRDKQMPDYMRIYSLVRPLTREEKLIDVERGPNDLVGRDAELAELHATFHHTVNRSIAEPARGTARVIAGEMGIGKTALINAFLQELPDDAKFFRAELTPARLELPYSVLGEWLRSMTNLHGESNQASVRTRLRESVSMADLGSDCEQILDRLAALVTGELAVAVDEGDAAQNRRYLTTGLRAFIARQALDGPVVLIADNLQWADRPSLEAIQELLRAVDPWPALYLLVTRSGERLIPHLEGLVKIELKELSLEQQVQLLKTRLGATQGVEEVCADLSPRIGGNPFFLLEMVDALLERGTLELKETTDHQLRLRRAEKQDGKKHQLPSTLEQLIGDRLDELPGEEQLVIEWLAVAGGAFKVADLREILGPQVDEAATRLCARGLCDMRGDSVDVRHPVTRDVAYTSIDPAARVAMHRAVGQHLAKTQQARGLSAAIVAHHLEIGREQLAAADHYMEAARTANQGYQLRLAKRYFRRVIRILPEDDPRRFESHEALEAICRVQGHWRERKDHLVQMRVLARKSSKSRWAATALMRTARFDADAGRLARALTAAQKAENITHAAGLRGEEVQAQALVGEILRDLGDMQGALAAIDRALNCATDHTVPARQRADVLRAKGTLLRRVGRVNEAISAQADAIAIFRRAGARRLEAQAKNALAFTLYVQGRFEDAISLGLDAVRTDLAIGGRLQIAKTLSNIGQAYASLGDTERGIAYLNRARKAHDSYGDHDAKADTLLCTAEVYVEMGDVHQAELLVQEASSINATTGSAYDTAHEKIVRALLAKLAGDAASAVMFAFDARQVAEAQAYVAFHFHAMAIEAAARVDIGEQHTGILLATTAMGAMETIQGSEYGLATRALCCEALRRAGSPQTEEIVLRAAQWVRRLAATIRDDELRQHFLARPAAAALLGTSANGSSASPSA